MSYARQPMGIYAQIIDAAAQATSAAVKAGAGAYQKAERNAKKDLQAARYDLEASQAGAHATERVAEIAAEGVVDAAQARITTERTARAKRQQVLIIGGAVVALGLGAVVLAFGGKDGT